MKKCILMLLLLVSVTLGYSQTKKKAPLKITEIQRVKKDALEWFKSVYVESYFKDPYSYKLLKSSIIPVSYSEGLSSMINEADRRFKDTDTLEWGSDYKEKQREYISSKRFHDSRYSKTDTTKETYINSKKHLDYQFRAVFNELKKHLSYGNERDSLMKIKESLSESKSSKVFYYIVYIDCYSNNSYGNLVLGKYSFYFNTNGLVRDPIQLNKD